MLSFSTSAIAGDHVFVQPGQGEGGAEPYIGKLVALYEQDGEMEEGEGPPLPAPAVAPEAPAAPAYREGGTGPGTLAAPAGAAVVCWYYRCCAGPGLMVCVCGMLWSESTLGWRKGGAGAGCGCPPIAAWGLAACVSRPASGLVRQPGTQRACISPRQQEIGGRPAPPSSPILGLPKARQPGRLAPAAGLTQGGPGPPTPPLPLTPAGKGCLLRP